MTLLFVTLLAAPAAAWFAVRLAHVGARTSHDDTLDLLLVAAVALIVATSLPLLVAAQSS